MLELAAVSLFCALTALACYRPKGPSLPDYVVHIPQVIALTDREALRLDARYRASKRIGPSYRAAR
jgi:hypothetical protein